VRLTQTAAVAEATDSSDRSWIPRFGTLLTSQLTFFMSVQLAMPFFAIYMRELGASESEAIALAGVMNFSSSLLMALSQSVWGVLSDRFGIKAMVVRGMLGGILTFSLMALVVAPWQVAGLRIFQGVAAGAGPSLMAMATMVLPVQKLGMGLGAMQAAQSISQSLGPAIGGFTISVIGFHGTFLLAAGCLSVVTLVVFFFLKEPVIEDTHNTRNRSLREGLSIVARTHYLRSPMIAMMAFQSAWLASNQLMPLHIYSLVPDQDEAARIVGFVLTSTAFGATLGAGASGWASGRVRPTTLALATMVGSGLVMIPQFWLTEPIHFIVLRFALGFVSGGTLPVLRTVLGQAAQRDPLVANNLGSLYGFSQSAMQGGVAFGAGIAAVIGGALGLPSVYAASGLIMLATGLWWVRAGRAVAQVSEEPIAL